MKILITGAKGQVDSELVTEAIKEVIKSTAMALKNWIFPRPMILNKSVEPTANVQCTESSAPLLMEPTVGDRSRYDSTDLFRMIFTSTMEK